MWYILSFLLAIASEILRGFLISKMWLWFIVPLGFPSITIAKAIGIFLICRTIVGFNSNKKIKDGEELCAYVLSDILSMLIIFAIAAVVNCFI